MLEHKVYTSLCDIQKNKWDGNVTLPFFMRYDLLHIIEKSKINNIKNIYYRFFDTKDIGRANLYLVKTDLSTFDSKLRKVRKTIKQWYPDFLKFTTLECGFFNAIGEGIALYDDSYYPDVLRKLSEEMDIIAAKHNAQMQFIRDVPLHRYRLYKSILKDLGFYPTPGFPDTEIHFQSNTLEDYLSQFKRHKRKNLRQQLRDVMENKDITYTFTSDYMDYAPIMALLWKNVSRLSDSYQREILDERYFSTVSEILHDKSEVLIFKKNGKIITFFLCMIDDDCYYIENYGTDYTCIDHKEFNIYKSGILLCLERAMTLHKSKAGLGITTYFPKLLLGAEIKPLIYFIKYTGNRNYSKALAKMFYDDIQQPDISIHDPFKVRRINTINLPKLCIKVRKDQLDLPHNDIFLKTDKYQRINSMRLAKIYNLYPEFNSAQKSSIHSKKMDNIILLGTNSYLGAANFIDVKEAAKNSIDKYGTGCSGSPLLNGTLDIHNMLEQKLERFTDREAVILCSTGFQTNLAGITALSDPEDVLIMDERSHRSIFDGAKLSGAHYYIYKHNNMEHLEWVLSKIKNKKKLIITDTVFSMEGIIADLPAICRLAKQYNARTFVDESHAIGVFGKRGRGICELLGVEKEVDIIMGTFSKSFASIGGFLAGKKEVIDFIKHTSSPHVFSASLPPSAICTVLSVLDIIEKQPELRNSILEKARYMADSLCKMGYDATFRGTQIVPVIFGNETLAMAAYKRFMEDGVYVNPILPPAVPETDSGFRTSYIATHQWEDLEKALRIFSKNRKAFIL